MITIELTYQGYHGNERTIVKDFKDMTHFSCYVATMQRKGCKNIRNKEIFTQPDKYANNDNSN
jgi:hypothetical protein